MVDVTKDLFMQRPSIQGTLYELVVNVQNIILNILRNPYPVTPLSQLIKWYIYVSSNRPYSDGKKYIQEGIDTDRMHGILCNALDGAYTPRE